MNSTEFKEYNNLSEIDNDLLQTTIFFIHIPKTGGTTLNNIYKNYDWFIQGGHCSFYKNILYLKPTFFNFFPLNFFLRKKIYSTDYFNNGYKEGMLRIAIIRNPLDWLFSIYKHYSYSKFLGFEVLKHNGWGNILGNYQINSFEEFVINYCNNKFNDYLVSDQLKPILNKGKIECDLILKNEYLNDFIKQYSEIKNIKLKNFKKLNQSSQKVLKLSPYANNLLNQKFSDFNELFYKSDSKFFLKNHRTS